MPLILNGTTGVSGIDGSAGTPSYVGGDSDTGLWYPAANTLALSTGGSERLRVDSSGNVGIGTTSPTTFGSGYINAQVQGTNGGAIWVSDGASVGSANFVFSGVGLGILGTFSNHAMTFRTNNTERMRIDSSGNVGINTGSPTQLLDVAGNAAITGTGILSLQRAIVPVTNQGTPQLVFQYYTTGTTYTTGAQIQALADGNWSSTSAPTNILFYTCPSASTTILERMRITSGGAILVGTTAINPGYGNSNTGVQLFSAASGQSNFSVNSLDWVITVNQNGSDSGTRYFMNFRVSNSSVGNIQSNGSNCTFNSTSDYRLKKDVAPLTNALTRVLQLKPVAYKWKLDNSAGEGFIAHELQEIVPECVTGEKDAVNEDGSIKPQGVDTSFLVATLTAAIQEQQAMIEELKAKVAALEK